jgi:hypothetical protein
VELGSGVASIHRAAQIRNALFVERRLELLKGLGLSAPTFLVASEPTHSPKNNLLQSRAAL